MPSPSSPASGVLAVVVGLTGVGVVLAALLLPSHEQSASPYPAVSPDVSSVLPSPAVSVPVPPSVSASSPAIASVPASVPAASPSVGDPSVSASPAVPAPSSTLPSDPMQLISSGLTAYQSALNTTGGAHLTLVTADAQTVDMSLAPNGDYQALTGVATAPEWVFANGRLYARLGAKEKKNQQAGLIAIGKPDANWTDAAVGSDKQAKMLSAGNMANAVADLVPLMKGAHVSPGENGALVASGTVDIASLGDAGLAYGLVPSTDAKASKAEVSFSVDPSGVLTGYVVTPPLGKQPVSALITQFTAVTVAEPAADQVVTLDDLAKAAAPSTPSVSPAPSAVASVPAFPSAQPAVQSAP